MQSIQTYGRDTVLHLLSHIDTVDLELKIAKEDVETAVEQFHDEARKVDRLIENVTQLQRELTQARNGKKIEVSKTVDEAIKYYKARDMLFLYNLPRIEQFAKDKKNEHAVNLAEHIFRRGYNEYFLAIINGYEIKETTPEQRLREDVDQLIMTWDRSSRKSTLAKDIDERITDYFQEIAK